MAVHTSAIFYSRGIPRNRTNFAFVSQSNNTIIVPFSLYKKRYSFYNRNFINKNIRRGALYPWNN